MRRVFSSHIDAIDYDSQRGLFTVAWKSGAKTTYFGVPPDVAANVEGAASIGMALHMHIRGKYEFKTAWPDDR